MGFGRGTLITAGVIALLIMMAFGSWGWRYYTAEIRGRVGAEETIQSGANRIARYNHFFDLCAAIQGYEDQLGAQTTQLEQTNNESERERIRANIAGITGQRMRSIREYNADARKGYTAGQFRDSSLPYQLNAFEYTPGGRATSCGI